MRFYGVTKFRVFSVLDDKGIYPIETKVEFYYDTSKKINYPRLKRILERYIKDVKEFFVVIEDNKIIIHIEYNNKIGLLDFDYEFCKN
jgi:hypothetical protein